MSDQLTGLAEEAGNYADAATVIRNVERRRRRRRVIVPVMALALVAAAIIGFGPVGSTRHGEPAFALNGVRLEPDPHAPALPADSPIGPAITAFRTCETCQWYLVSGKGHQYRVGPGVVSLSLDGRWLAVSHDGRTDIRDLTGTRTLTDVPLNGIDTWSPNGRYAVGYDSLGGHVIDLVTGTRTTGAGDLVTDDGVSIGAGPANSVDLHSSEISLEAVGGGAPWNVGTGALLRSNEGIVMQSSDGTEQMYYVSPGPAGQMLVAVYVEPQRPGPAISWPQTAVLVGPISGPTLTRRVDLPANAGDPFFFGVDVAFPAQANPSAPIEIRAVTAAGTTTLMSFPPHAWYVVRGMQFTAHGA